MTGTITTDGVYTVGASADLTFHTVPAFILGLDHDKQTGLDLAGSITIHDRHAGGAGIGVDASDGVGDVAIHVEPGGSFSLSETGSDSGVTGFHLDDLTAAFANEGEIMVTNTGGGAMGAQIFGATTVSNAGDLTVEAATTASGLQCEGHIGQGQLLNSGSVSVAGGDTAVGIAAFKFQLVDNAGAITVSADNAQGIYLKGCDLARSEGHIDVSSAVLATGVTIDEDATSFDNQGTITVTSGGDPLAARGVWTHTFSTRGITQIANEGVIRAELAIASGSAFATREAVVNTGKIFGMIDLATGNDSVVNSGKIVGDVLLGSGDDIYDGGHGQLSGVLNGGEGADKLTGGAGDDVIWGDGPGGWGADQIVGGKGADALYGDGADDVLTGGLGADTLDGGAGDDRFVFLSLKDSRPAAADQIVQLDATDTIDLSAIDADATKTGDQAFHLVGALGGHAGELTLHYDSAAGLTTLSADVNGDGAADMQVRITGDASGFAHFVL